MCVQGPPGTGKTRTLLALISVLVGSSASNPASWAAMGPLLACADTNAAVDNIVEGLLQAKGAAVRVVRIGNPAKARVCVGLELWHGRRSVQGRRQGNPAKPRAPMGAGEVLQAG